MLNTLILAGEDAAGSTGLGFPTVVVGIIAMSIFILLGVITWSYRDVANRHSHKSGSNSHH
ncbi:MAG: hypothetical protein ACKOWK_05960 [Micrococcales bacterium]